MRIAVIGGGNGAYAAAADLTARGHQVRLWRRNAQALAASKALTLKDADGERRIEVASVSPDIAAALRGAELVFMPDPAFTQLDHARRIAPHLADGQVVFFAPGPDSELTQSLATSYFTIVAPPAGQSTRVMLCSAS